MVPPQVFYGFLRFSTVFYGFLRLFTAFYGFLTAFYGWLAQVTPQVSTSAPMKITAATIITMRQSWRFTGESS